MTLTWLHPAFSMTVDWDYQNAPLHMIRSFDSHFWNKNVRFPAVVDRIYSIHQMDEHSNY